MGNKNERAKVEELAKWCDAMRYDNECGNYWRSKLREIAECLRKLSGAPERVMKIPPNGEIQKRRDREGRIDFMASAKGYVMVRRPGCLPFVMSLKDWIDLPLWVKKP